MTERRIKPGHTHAAQALAPLCREMEQALHADHDPVLDPKLSPVEWPQAWLARLGPAAVRIATGINRLGSAAEADSEEIDPEVETALAEIRSGVRALIVLHEEAALTVPLADPFLRNSLMDIAADTLRQIHEFLDRYVTIIEDPDIGSTSRIDLTLELHRPVEIDTLIEHLRHHGNTHGAGNYSGTDLLLTGLVGLGLGLWIA